MRHWTRTAASALTLSLTMALILVGGAQATRPDDKAGPRGVGAIGALASDAIVRPDDRGTLRGPGAFAPEARTHLIVRPDDRAGRRGPAPAIVAAATSASAADDGGFPWSGAGLGAGLLAFVAMLGTVLVLSGRYQRRPV